MSESRSPARQRQASTANCPACDSAVCWVDDLADQRATVPMGHPEMRDGLWKSVRASIVHEQGLRGRDGGGGHVAVRRCLLCGRLACETCHELAVQAEAARATRERPWSCVPCEFVYRAVRRPYCPRCGRKMLRGSLAAVGGSSS